MMEIGLTLGMSILSIGSLAMVFELQKPDQPMYVRVLSKVTAFLLIFVIIGQFFTT